MLSLKLAKFHYIYVYDVSGFQKKMLFTKGIKDFAKIRLGCKSKIEIKLQFVKKKLYIT